MDFAMLSWKPLVETLQTAQFIGKSWGEEKAMRFLIGDQFLNFITFMGGSPYIVFEPPPDGSLNFCHIQLGPIYSATQFRCSANNVFARCPKCRKRINNWEPAIAHWRINPSAKTLHCDKCQGEISIYQLGWRHTAGFARMFVDIYSIYPHEGVPTDSLIALLETASGTAWDYFYSDH
jgi:hypothetical protein